MENFYLAIPALVKIFALFMAFRFGLAAGIVYVTSERVSLEDSAKSVKYAYETVSLLAFFAIVMSIVAVLV